MAGPEFITHNSEFGAYRVRTAKSPRTNPSTQASAIAAPSAGPAARKKTDTASSSVFKIPCRFMLTPVTAPAHGTKLPKARPPAASLGIV